MGTGIEVIRNDLKARLDEIMTRGKSSKGAAQRIYPLYQQLQIKRFQSENASEGTQWPKLNSEYARYKLRRYGGGSISRGTKKGSKWGNWPGGGKRMLLGTSTLAGAVIGPGTPFEGTEGFDHHLAMFKPWSIQISVSLSGTNAEGKPFTYPSYVAATRPFMNFSAGSIQKMRDAMAKYLIGTG